jgi:hypothetical protein
MNGIHGGPATRHQVAVVAGGHPRVRNVADAIAKRPPRAQFWARNIARAVGATL